MHYNLKNQIFRYLSKIFDFKITFTTNLRNNLVGYINFNYAKLINGQKFTSDYIFILFGRFLSY